MDEFPEPEFRIRRCAALGALAGFCVILVHTTHQAWTYRGNAKPPFGDDLGELICIGPLAALMGTLGGVIVGYVLYRIRDGVRRHKRNSN